jgi:hypothetical protein
MDKFVSTPRSWGLLFTTESPWYSERQRRLGNIEAGDRPTPSGHAKSDASHPATTGRTCGRSRGDGVRVGTWSQAAERTALGKSNGPFRRGHRLTISIRYPLMDASSLALSAEQDSHPSPELSPELRALWLAKKGRWDEAHDLCQEIPGTAGPWIHAWLRRQEGDYGNACYWYQRARKPAPDRSASLDDEWFEIAQALAS